AALQLAEVRGAELPVREEDALGIERGVSLEPEPHGARSGVERSRRLERNRDGDGGTRLSCKWKVGLARSEPAAGQADEREKGAHVLESTSAHAELRKNDWLAQDAERQ